MLIRLQAHASHASLIVSPVQILLNARQQVAMWDLLITQTYNNACAQIPPKYSTITNAS